MRSVKSLMSHAAVIGLVCATLASGCGPTGERVARLSELSTPRVEAFAGFERWVHRAHDGATSLSGQGLIEEAAFSPIRNRSEVLAAAIAHRSRGEARLVFPPEARFPASIEWVPVLHGAQGEVDVAELSNCELGLPKWWRRGVPRRCVLLSRTTSRGVAEDLTVTLAFAY